MITSQAAQACAAVLRLHRPTRRYQHDPDADTSFDTPEAAAEHHQVPLAQISYFLVCRTCSVLEAACEDCELPYEASMYPCATAKAAGAAPLPRCDGTCQACHTRDHHVHASGHYWYLDDPIEAQLATSVAFESPADEGGRCVAACDICPNCQRCVECLGCACVYFTADVIAVRGDEILLIERRWAPFTGQRALPGGYVDDDDADQVADPDDEIAVAAVTAAREAREETGLKLTADQLRHVGRYDDPGRDPRGRVISNAFVVEVPADTEAVAADDAAAADWIPITAALKMRLAFDHDRILRDAIQTRRRDRQWCRSRRLP